MRTSNGKSNHDWSQPGETGENVLALRSRDNNISIV